jgi:hypothetical protein
MTPLETLRALGTGEDAPLESKQRVYGALLASLEVAAAAGIAAVPKPPASVHPALVPAGAISVKTAAIAASIWLLGGVTGAAVYGALRPSQVRVVYVERPAPMSVASIAVPMATSGTLEGVTAPSEASSRSVVSHPVTPLASSAARGTGSELAQERELLDLARSNAARGEPALALAQVEQHRERFPQGHLSEEREALGIRALLALGRTQEALDRAQAFRAAHPSSFLLPVIDSALSAP